MNLYIQSPLYTLQDPREEEQYIYHLGSIKYQEQQRIEFIIRRDGPGAGVEFCDRTKKIYRQAVLNPKHHASTRAYRRQFIESYIMLKNMAQMYRFYCLRKL